MAPKGAPVRSNQVWASKEKRAVFWWICLNQDLVMICPFWQDANIAQLFENMPMDII